MKKTPDELLEKILAMNLTSGVKIYLVTMYYYEDPMTTREFNSYLNKNLTLNNLEDAFEELIEKNIITVISKNINGVKRKAFKLNLKAIEDLEEDDDE